MVGFLVENSPRLIITDKVTYDPYKYDTFVDSEEKPVYTARYVQMKDAVYALGAKDKI